MHDRIIGVNNTCGLTAKGTIQQSAFDTVLIKTLKCHDNKVLIAYFS